jgi:hypothetical protein
MSTMSSTVTEDEAAATATPASSTAPSGATATATWTTPPLPPPAEAAAADTETSVSKPALPPSLPSPTSSRNNNTNNNSNKFDFGSYVPEDKVQYIVQTPYGRGLTIRTWQHDAKDQKPSSSSSSASFFRMREIELIDWNSASTSTSTTITRGPVRPATLFSPTLFPSVQPQVDDDIICVYGRGRVIEVRKPVNHGGSSSDGSSQIVVRLSSWRLAGRCTVTCILNTNILNNSSAAVQVVRKKKMYEMNTVERVELAQELKNTAGLQFGKKDYRTALQTYNQAVDSLRYISEANSRAVAPEIRADLVMLMITCNNNAATCAWNLASSPANSNSSNDTTADTEKDTTQRQQQQQQSMFYAERTFKYARDALVLLDALEKNKGQKIHQQLVQNKDGGGNTYSDTKLFGEMKVKSYILQARALMHQYETVQALECLKTAHDIIAHYTSNNASSSSSPNGDRSNSTQAQVAASIKNLHASSKEIKKLHQTCRERRLKEKQKEKLRAQAMFAGGSLEEKKGISSSPQQPSSPTNVIMQHLQQENGESARSKNNGEYHHTNNDDNNDGDDTVKKEKAKRRVSFSEKVTFKEETEGSEVAEYEEHPLRPPAISPKKKKNSTINDNKARNNINSNDNNTDELEWHEDPEVVTGLCIFAGTVAVTVMGALYLLSGNKRS